MKDTSAEMEKLHFEMLMNRTSEERIKIASSMFTTARKVIIASIPKDLSPPEFQQKLYKRTYGEELPADFFFRGQ